MDELVLQTEHYTTKLRQGTHSGIYKYIKGIKEPIHKQFYQYGDYKGSYSKHNKKLKGSSWLTTGGKISQILTHEFPKFIKDEIKIVRAKNIAEENIGECIIFNIY